MVGTKNEIIKIIKDIGTKNKKEILYFKPKKEKV